MTTESDTPIEGEVPVVVEGEEAQSPELTPDEQLATSRGWKPKDQWDGPEDEWKPAKVFNQIGELKEQLVGKDKDLKKVNKVLDLMKEHHLRVRETAIAEAIRELKAQRAAALDEQDFGAAEKIRDQIDDVKTKFANTGALPQHIEQEVQAQTNEPDPELFAFMDRNAWYKPNSTDAMSKKADALGWAYKTENPDMPFKEIIKNVESDIRKLFPEKFATPRNPVNESGTRSSGSSGSSAKVHLTDEQKAIAKGFGMTEAAYAKELDSYKGR
jgi:hypothetical protein